MPSYLFWLFTTIMLIGGVAVVAFRNPVSSALAMVTYFVGLAALFIGLSAFFVGIIQILVYSGAIMVLFLFIIMLLDLSDEKKRVNNYTPLVAGLVLVAVFFIQLIGVLSNPLPNQAAPALSRDTLATAASATVTTADGTEQLVFATKSKIALALNDGRLPDVHLIGHTIFTEYNLPLQILGVILLVATVGAVVLSKRQTS